MPSALINDSRHVRDALLGAGRTAGEGSSVWGQALGSWGGSDGGDGIANDQIFFGDPRLVPADARQPTAEQGRAVAALRAEEDALRTELATLNQPTKVYAVVPGQP